VRDSDWCQVEPTEKSKWVLPLTTTSHQSKSTVPIIVVMHYRAWAKSSLVNVEHPNSQILTIPFACVLTVLPFCPCQFIGCDAYGICVRVFCDFGEEFEVSDPTGEEPKEIFIQSITQVVFYVPQPVPKNNNSDFPFRNFTLILNVYLILFNFVSWRECISY